MEEVDQLAGQPPMVDQQRPGMPVHLAQQVMRQARRALVVQVLHLQLALERRALQQLDREKLQDLQALALPVVKLVVLQRQELKPTRNTGLLTGATRYPKVMPRYWRAWAGMHRLRQPWRH